jgi:hypothetical protein
VDLLKCVPGSFSETRDDRNQVIRVKVEELTDVEEETSSVSACTEREDEHEVSCICLYIVIHILKISSISCCFSDLQSYELNLKNPFINI